jgi:hypothetical protein
MYNRAIQQGAAILIQSSDDVIIIDTSFNNGGAAVRLIVSSNPNSPKFELENCTFLNNVINGSCSIFNIFYFIFFLNRGIDISISVMNEFKGENNYLTSELSKHESYDTIDTGDYEESTWEIYSGKTLTIKGVGKDEKIVTDVDIEMNFENPNSDEDEKRKR